MSATTASVVPAPVASAPRFVPGGPGLVAIDALATGAIAAMGFQVARMVDPFALAHWPKRGLIALPFALLATLGVGIERGRTERPTFAVGLVAALGAALGGILALLHAEWPFPSWRALAGERAWDALVLAGPVLLAGPLLARAGARLSRPDEPWREAAREGPAVATPPLATRIAAVRVPFVVKLVASPLVLAALPLAAAGLVLIRCYQLTLSRLMPPQCRFEPSCSRYGFEAFWRHGLVKGAALTAYRVGRCQPFCRGGHDPVPGGSG